MNDTGSNDGLETEMASMARLMESARELDARLREREARGQSIQDVYVLDALDSALDISHTITNDGKFQFFDEAAELAQIVQYHCAVIEAEIEQQEAGHV